MVNAAASTTSLALLFEKYGTDKCRSGYHHIYQDLFRHRRDTITRVLEVGIGTLNPDANSTMVGYAGHGYRPGGSLRAWRDYFPDATIWGIDTQHDTQITEHRIKTRLADSTNAFELESALKDLSFDIIIDDGDHHPASQLTTLANLWHRVKPGGVYVIEDIVDNPHRNYLVLHAQ